MARQLVDRFFDHPQLLLQLPRHGGQIELVQGDAVALHDHQDMDQRHLDLLEQGAQPQAFELGHQHLLQPPGIVGILAGVLRHLCDRHLVHGALVPAGAKKLRSRDLFQAEVLQRDRVEIVLKARGIEQIVGDHRIAEQTSHLNAVARKHKKVIFGVVAAFFDGRIRQQRSQGRQHFPGRKGLLIRREIRRPLDRDVPGLPLGAGEGEADQLRPCGIDRGGLGVEGEGAAAAETLHQHGEGLPVADQLVAVHGGGSGAEALDQGGEIHLPEEISGLVRRNRPEMQIFNPGIEGHVAMDGGEGFGEARQIGVFLQGGAVFF